MVSIGIEIHPPLDGQQSNIHDSIKERQLKGQEEKISSALHDNQ